ncbi:MAG: tetratricopeptide repeat protein [Verrucomicrobiota bacterium]|jgi:tetratricopeptide (TPR) repeat protein
MSERPQNPSHERLDLAMPSGRAPNPGNCPPPEGRRRQRWLSFAVCVLLALAVWAVFGQTRRFDFVNYDDGAYVYDNQVVTHGLTWHGAAWALTYGKIGHWHPLTWLSHMLDCQLYGLNPAGPHLTNVLLHAANAILLFLLLRNMTGALWRSAVVAAVFAVHPLRVESVAWVSERKDVLSGLFFMVTLLCYAKGVSCDECRVIREENSDSQAKVSSSPVTRHPSLFYWLAVVCFALGLLSKSMLVTTPWVLLLLDYWPLGRFTPTSDVGVQRFTPKAFGVKRLLVEKIPFLVLSAASCAATLLVPEELAPGNQVSFALRLENAFTACLTYIWQMIYPARLAGLYPYPANGPSWAEVALALAVFVAVSFAALAGWKKRPYFLVGWLWYLGMLAPVIGLVQISYYAHADRYTYLPQIGLYILVAWGAVELCRAWRWRRAVLGAVAGLTLAVLMACAHSQAGYWQDSVTLWEHTLACTTDNPLADHNLGNALGRQGKFAEAIPHFEQALKLKPDSASSHISLGVALDRQGKWAEAIPHFERVIKLQPDDAEAYYDLGYALAGEGKFTNAIPQYQRAIQIKPDYAEAYDSLGVALAAQGRAAEAMQDFDRAIQLDPDLAEAHYNLSLALANQGRWAESIEHLERAVQTKPDYAAAHFNLGTELVLEGRGAEALPHFQQAVNLATAQGNAKLAEAARARLKANQQPQPK